MIRSTWALPLLLGVSSVIGLITALAGDGWHDWVAWATLAAPVAATIWAMRIQRS
ncbi:hypothetical protein [Sphingomonas aracearum]|uniref:hypothetical protein n=1 Tax=Sphingomonas aracearum TaxID=2283317 RepID=UPI0015EFF862|nr:hypothetical protein [Sphingomonas aracearum]